MIELNCPSCGRAIWFQDGAAGSSSACRRCGVSLFVPAPPTDVERLPVIVGAELTEIAARRIRPQPVARQWGWAAVLLGTAGCVFGWSPLGPACGLALGSAGLALAILAVLKAAPQRGGGFATAAGGSAVCLVAILWALSRLNVSSTVQPPGRPTSPNPIAATASVLSSHGVPQDTARENAPGGEIVQGRPPLTREQPPRAGGQNNRPDHRQVNVALGPPPQDPDASPLVSVRVISASVGTVEIEDFGETRPSREPLLKIEIEIENRDEARKLDYESWSGANGGQAHLATLADDLGNGYQRVTLGLGTRVVGQIQSRSIYPGRSGRDLLLFETPVDKAQRLTLELPSAAYGGSGTQRLTIPVEIVSQD